MKINIKFANEILNKDKSLSPLWGILPKRVQLTAAKWSSTQLIPRLLPSNRRGLIMFQNF